MALSYRRHVAVTTAPQSAHGGRDAANELYEQGCALLEAAQGLRAASRADSAPALAATLGCLEASLEELRVALSGLAEVAVHRLANAGLSTGSLDQELLGVHQLFEQLRADLAAVQADCAATRELVGPLLAGQRKVTTWTNPSSVRSTRPPPKQ